MHMHQPGDLVQLDVDHPGFRDVAYRKRRDVIARAAFAHQPSEPAPQIDYEEEEHAVWRLIRQKLAPLHARHAARIFVDALPVLDPFADRIPQMEEINGALANTSGFRMIPVAGLVRPEVFMEALAERRFLATQYIRHASQPLYTPEPDLVHEYVGHAALLSLQRYARLNEAFGHATRRATPAEIEALIRLFWFSLEFGVVREDGEPKAFGAGLLSSFGELGRFEHEAQLAPYDVERIFQTPFDPTTYQRTVFVADSLEALESAMLSALDRVGRAR